MSRSGPKDGCGELFGAAIGLLMVSGVALLANLPPFVNFVLFFLALGLVGWAMKPSE
jgi:hypothetical protein